MDEITNYDEAVKVIKLAILQSQYNSAKAANENQLMLYFAVGKYISLNSRGGFWGKGAIDTISNRLDKELPGLRGFSARNLRYMRTFYEEWRMLDNSTDGILALASAKMDETTENDEIWHLQVPNSEEFPVEEFLSIGFTQHRTIFEKIKDVSERYYYIRRCAYEKYSVSDLKESIQRDDYRHQGKLPNNFKVAIRSGQQALKAISVFKDEYLLDYINVEELSARDDADIDERVVENAIVHNVKNFILTFGKDFAFVRNQYHLDAFGEDQYIDLLFFNRELNCLVAVELKKGKFKTSYLGQLQGYLSVLDGYEKKPHENPSIGLILCKDMNKSYVDYVIQDYAKPMGVATYKTAKDMSEEFRKALPDIEALRKLLDADEE
ncbi:MAG: PDDEXK nuclease domain-containing protein [Lachnospiraceae bacterium]|nr:PDDEXK nuclease domain-containing protein [Lachnospiraceae bacterium]